jgi:hypothetical protein
MHLQTSRQKLNDGGVYVQRRLVDYGHNRGDKTGCPWSIDYYRFENLMLEALSELDERTFARKSSGIKKEQLQLRDELVVLDKQMKTISNQMANPKYFSITDTLLDNLARLKDREKDVEERLERLEVTAPIEKERIVEGLRTISTICGSDSTDKRTRRKELREIIPHIVKRIEVLPLKKSNRTVVALICIDLSDGTRRILWMEKQKPKPPRTLLADKSGKPILLHTADGTILFSRLHEGRSREKGLALFINGKPHGIKDQEKLKELLGALSALPKIIFRKLSTKETQKWKKVDLRTIFNYDYHGKNPKPNQKENSDGNN